MNNRVLAYLFTGLLLASCQLFAKAHQAFYSLEIPRGQVSAQINKVYQQKNGFVWFGTTKGVARYDGHNFVTYQYSPGSPFHIDHNFVVDIIEDHQGAVWIATEAGLNRIHPDGRIDSFTTADGLPSVWILAIFQHSSKKLKINSKTQSPAPLIFITAEGVVTFSFESQRFEPLLDTKHIADAITSDEKGNLYLPLTNTLIKVNPNTSQVTTLGNFSSLNQGKEIYSYAAAYLNDSVIFSGEEGLLRWQQSNNSFDKLSLGAPYDTDFVNDLQVHEGKLWIAFYRSGIAQLDLETMELQAFRANELNPYSLPSDNINDIEIDNRGNLWVGTSAGVTTLFDNKNLRLLQPRPEFNVPSKNEVHFIERRGKQLLIASVSGVDAFDTTTEQWQRDPLDFSSQNIDATGIWTISSRNEYTWLAGDQGLYLFNHNTKALEHFTNKEANPWQIPKRELYTVLADDQGAWFTGYVDVGLKHFTLDKKLRLSLLDQDSDQYTSDGNYSYQTLLTETGIMWMATTDGLFQVDTASGASHHYRLGNAGGYIRVSSIALDGKDTLWATTEGEGLLKVTQIDKLGSAEIQRVSDKVSLPSLDFHSMVVTDTHIWASALDHIVKLDKQTYAVALFPIPMRVKNLNVLPTSAHIVDDNLYIGTNLGVLTLDTTQQPEKSAHEVYITNLASDGVNHNELLNALNMQHTAEKSVEKSAEKGAKQSIKLPGASVQLSLSAFEYQNPDLVTYFYRVNGGELQTLEGHTLTLHKLWPGNYQLELGYSTIPNHAPDTFSHYQFSIQIPTVFYIYGVGLLIIVLLTTTYLVEKKRHVQRLENETVTDSLTGIHNRLGFNQQYRRLFTRQAQFALILIDLDRFKDINDLHGHGVGDLYLQTIANKLQTCTTKNDVVARLSGDEFAILMPYNGQVEDLVKHIARIHEQLEIPYALNRTIINAQLSFGAALAHQHANTPEELYSLADAALYHSKRNGRRKTTMFNDEVKASLQLALMVKSSLSEALLREQFELHYQPKVCSVTGHVTSLEALIRWNHPEHGYIPPDIFIEKAEETGDILAIGNWVLRQACKDIERLLKDDLFRGKISINVSPLQLKSDAFIDEVNAALSDYNIPTKHLEMEITETSIVDNFEQANQAINQLRALGVSIALDDFGSGYSSLAYLTKLNFDTLKVDRSLIQELTTDSKAEKLIDVVFQLAGKFNLNVVIEGVETQPQQAFFEHFPKCELQGFYFYKPTTLAKLEPFF